MTASTCERLLEAIRNADSAHPAALDKVAIAAGIGLEAAAAAAERLYQQRRINRCERSAGGILTTLIWPTGAVKPLGAYTGASHSALFVKTTPAPKALHAAHSPKVQPAPAPRVEKQEEPAMPATAASAKRRSSNEVAQILDGLLSGRPMSNPVSTLEIAQALGYQSRGGISKTMQIFISRDDVAQWIGVTKMGNNNCYYDKEAKEAETETPQPAPRAAAQRARTAESFAQPPAQAPRSPVDPDDVCSFALWDDGRLSIYNGQEHIEVQPAQVKKLALLLGVPA